MALHLIKDEDRKADAAATLSAAFDPKSARPLTLREIFVKKITIDERDGKAQNIQLFSLRRPHMRAFHLAWLGFFTAFTSWFALSPLLKKSIKPAVGLTEADLANSDIAAVSSTVIMRFFIGPFVDKLGPSRMMAVLLVAGSIPLALTVLIKDGPGLIVSRAFIGILGATFVPCQAWTTAMFSKRVIGTANAVAAGWGNMGAGATYLLMPQVYAMFIAFGLSSSLAWKVSLIIPVVLCFVVAALVWRLGDDKPPAPLGKTDSIQIISEDKELLTKVTDETEPTGPSTSIAPNHAVGGSDIAQKHSFWYILYRCFSDPNVLILMVAYACCFGVELSVDSVIGNYFIKKFGVDQQIGGLFGALFGLLNIFSRATGGLTSDYLASKMGMQGRYLWQIFLFTLSAASIIGFSYAQTISTAVIAMILFSYACQAGTGSTFGIVPFLGAYMGTASGLIGAGGNIGGAVFNVVFRIYLDDPATAFRIMGIVVAIGGAFLTIFLNVQNENLLALARGRKNGEKAKAKVPADDKETSGAVVEI